MTLEDLLDEQRRYYEARAFEYEEWMMRSGIYSQGARQDAQWRSEIACLNTQARTTCANRRVLEIAAGTGAFTRTIVQSARHVIAVDISATSLILNRERMPAHAAAAFCVGDLFQWPFRHSIEVICAFFWLTHVPAGLLPAFLDRVATLLEVGGAFLFADNRVTPYSRTSHVKPISDGIEQRHLLDGTAFHVCRTNLELLPLIPLFQERRMALELSAHQHLLVGTAKKLPA